MGGIRFTTEWYSVERLSLGLAFGEKTMDEMRTCKHCNVNHPITEYQYCKRRDLWYGHSCRSCRNKIWREKYYERRHTDKEKEKELDKPLKERKFSLYGAWMEYSKFTGKAKEERIYDTRFRKMREVTLIDLGVMDKIEPVSDTID